MTSRNWNSRCSPSRATISAADRRAASATATRRRPLRVLRQPDHQRHHARHDKPEGGGGAGEGGLRRYAPRPRPGQRWPAIRPGREPARRLASEATWAGPRPGRESRQAALSRASERTSRVTAVRKGIADHMPPPVSGGVAGGVPEGRDDRDRADDRSCRGHDGGRRRGRHGPHTSRAAPVSVRHTAVLIGRPAGQQRAVRGDRPSRTADRCRDCGRGRTRPASPRRGPRRTRPPPAPPGAESWPARRARPRSPRKPSAVLNDIGCWLPKRKMTVARANQAAITVRPTAAHSRPPAVVIASGTRPLRDSGAGRAIRRGRRRRGRRVAPLRRGSGSPAAWWMPATVPAGRQYQPC